MQTDIATKTGSGQISSEALQVMVIEFHARSTNLNPVYVGMSDVSNSNGRELPPGEAFTLNYALAYELDRRHPDILLSQFYVWQSGDDALDWSGIFR